MDATVQPLNNHNRKDDIVFVLAPMEGKDVKSVTGLVDNRLFSNEHQLHAKCSAGLWYLTYDAGVLPQPLKQRFTSWYQLHKFVSDYFLKRNVQIKEIID